MWQRRSHSRQQRRLALALWAVWAVLVWNVVFDHVIVVAGREYITAATASASHGGPYLRIDDWMQPALSRAFRIASASVAAILAIGFLLFRSASTRTD